MYAALVGLFAGIAALVAAMGIYGVMVYTVAQRTREIGIRMALGAEPADVMALVMRQSLGLALAGLLVGVAGAAAFSRQLQGMLFGVTPLDSATYLGVPIAFGMVACLAAYLPARRATRVDPMVALRRE
jgi:ABC-type antimicrobial peptide transport system permease subunit